MSGYLSHDFKYLIALCLVCPSPCCAQFSPDRAAREACCQTTHPGHRDAPIKSPEPVANCCCLSDVTLSSNSVPLECGGGLPLVEFRCDTGLGSAIAGRFGHQNTTPGPPVRVLQCVWLN